MSIRDSFKANPDFDPVKRLKILRVVVFLFVVVFIGRLAHLQIKQGGQYKLQSETQAIKQVIVEPFRGNMYDRDSTLIVHNKPSFSVSITPNDFKLESIELLKEILPEVDTNVVRKVVSGANYYSRFTPYKIYRDAAFEEVAALEEYSDYLPGVDIVVESKRLYEFNANIAHVLGYTREVSAKQLEHSRFYTAGDIIGQRGLEKSYERQLRGKKGVQFIAVNSAGKKIASFDKGLNDVSANNGFDLYLTLDMKLQEKAERLLDGKRGSVVAIDPRNGEILAFVSKPDFDPRDFSGKVKPELFNKLSHDTTSPFLNRAAMSEYPPGSTWKPLMAIAALQEGLIDKDFKLHCGGGFRFGSRRHKCHGAHGPVDVEKAIRVSCNTFFYQIGLKLGFDRFYKYGKMFGFGEKTHIDLPNERKGLLPSLDWLQQRYNGTAHSLRGRLVNYGIGQGEILVTPLQMAVYVSAIANDGLEIQPHVVRAVYNNITKRIETVAYDERRLPVDQWVFDIVKEGMYGVCNSAGGTAHSAQIPGYDVCGKTGTAQNPHGRDHAWFICFAPKDNPTIAMSVFIENAGFGGSVAAPVARKLMMTHFGLEVEKSAQPDSAAVDSLNRAPAGPAPAPLDSTGAQASLIY